MMGRQGVRILIALLLIAFGALALLSNLNILPFDLSQMPSLWALIFGLGGLAFVIVFASDIHANWWAVIPGFTLLGLGALIGFPAVWNEYGGALFLGSIGLSFWVIFLVKREFWWAIIPGGTLVTLAGVAAGSATGRGLDMGGYFFLGLGLTFLLVYLVQRMIWAIWPAAVLGLMGALLLSGAPGLARFIWPAALIVFGGVLVLRALKPSAR